MNIKRLSGIILLILLFLSGAAGGYFYFSKVFSKDRPPTEEIVETLTKAENLFSLRIYYPAGDRLQMEERRILRRTAQMAIAEATVEEFLKGPAGVMVSNIPSDARLLCLYKDADRILYVDLSDEFRRNFKGDAVTEFLLLKGLYESLVSNIQDIKDVKVLIEGKEIETLGGHLYLSYPLKDMVLHE
ncbi:MAG: GerMN domain-containing protein [Nitrospirae bacterium]|nr:GerMN domain-containing protein [Nitrospirota bacterium]